MMARCPECGDSDLVMVSMKVEPGEWECPVCEWGCDGWIHAKLDRIAELEAEVERLRGLLAEMLALNPIVSGDMEKVRVWAATLKAARAALNPAEAGEGEEDPSKGPAENMRRLTEEGRMDAMDRREDGSDG